MLHKWVISLSTRLKQLSNQGMSSPRQDLICCGAETHCFDIPPIFSLIRKLADPFVIELKESEKDPDSSNWYQWRTRLQPIRTASEIQVKIVIEPTEQTPLYQKLASKIEELYLLGMSLRAIAKNLKINRKTVLRALKLKNRLKTQPGRQK